jgi:hypothetical protein
MVADGKITSEEAERLLEALESRAPAEDVREQVRETAGAALGKIGEAIQQAMSFGEGGFPVPTPMAALFGRGGEMKGEPVEGAEDGIELPPDAVVEINTTAGDVLVRGGRTDGRMIVHDDEDGVQVSREGDRFYVACMAADVEVELPTVSELVLKHTGGDVEVEEVAADLTVRVSGGDVEVAGCRGALKGHILGGDVEVEGTVTSLDLDCKGGDFELHGLALREGKHHIKHMGGDVDVFLTPDASVRVHVSTMGGDVEADVEPETSSGGLIGQKRTYVYGGGAAALTVRSMGGDLSIQRSAPAAAAAADTEAGQ